MDIGFIQGQVAVVQDQTEWSEFIIRTQDGDFHVDFDDGYYHQCMAKRLDGKTVRLGYYGIDTNPDGTRWVRAGDDNVLEEIIQNEIEEENVPKKILKRHHETINNNVKEVINSSKMSENVKKINKSKVFFKIICINYNNYAYIKKCLESVFSQTFDDFFLVVVDDMSIDNSLKICEIFKRRYPQKMDFIRLKEKRYAGGARNEGIDYPIDSEYTWFIDSDDWLYDENVLKRLHSTALKNNFPEVIRCSYSTIEPDGSQKNIIEKPEIHEILKSGMQPWKSVIRSSINVRFVEHRAKNNDMVWGFRLFDFVNDKNIIAETYPCYVYNKMSSTSCQNNLSIILRKDCIDAQKQLLIDLKKEKYRKNIIEKNVNDIISRWRRWTMEEISIHDFFKNSFMITIDDSKFQFEMSLFQKFFGKYKPVKINGSHDKKLTGPQNCLKSHISIVEYAKRKNLPFAVVFEDDAYPRINCMELLEQYIRIIPRDANMVLLGWSNHMKQKPQKFNQCFNKITSIISGSHSYILFKSAYDKYLTYAKNVQWAKADGTIYNNVGTTYILNEPLFIQYSAQKSMNKHIGYIYYGDHPTPPEGFPKIEDYL